MRIERIGSVFSGGVSPVYRNNSGNTIKQRFKKTSKPSVSESFAILFEKATAELAKSLKDAGKVTYGKYGAAMDYDGIVGTLYDEKA